MNIEKQIIDQRLIKIVEDNSHWFDEGLSLQQQKEHAYIALGLSSYLNLELEEALAHLCDGSQDGGIDALYVGEVDNDEFTVCILQSKYSDNLEKDKGFPKTELIKIADTIGCFFDPSKHVTFNEKVTLRMAEIRSLIQEGCIPYVKVICLNNGKKWESDSAEFIDNSIFKNEQISISYINHTDILQSLKETKQIDANLRLSGGAFIEDFDFKRVLVGKIPVTEIAALIDEHGDSLLDKNIRRYLGIHKNHVNSKIRTTLLDEVQRKNFYFYNNGITMLCKQLRHNALQENDWAVKLAGLQIINGGQTSKTIQATIAEAPLLDYSDAYVMVRIYELSEDDVAAETLTTNITIATNSQSPVDLKDLRANDDKQKNLTMQALDLGYEYITKRSSVSSNSATRIPSSVAAEAVFSIWMKRPNSARFRRTELFGKYYDDVFGDLNGAQMVLAVLIYRYCDTSRKKQAYKTQYPHIGYSTHFIAMYIGKRLLTLNNLQAYDEISHLNFAEIKRVFEEHQESLYLDGLKKISELLPNHLPSGAETDLRKLSAIFRRGDLVAELS